MPAEQHKNPKTDIQIAQEARKRPIMELARAKLGIEDVLEVPFDEESAAKAATGGTPIVVSSPDSSFSAFVRLLVERCLNMPPSHGRKTSLWESVKGTFA